MAIRYGPWPRLAILACLAVHLFPLQVLASDQSALCERAIVLGSQRSGVPQEVLHAISLTETGRRDGGRLRPWPWAVNREGQGHWFKTRDEALAFARKSIAEGRHSFDVGCFQINYHWHGHNFPSIEAMFEPEIGADYAARFLQDLYAESGSWSRAAGSYHSRTPQYANIYRARFDRILGDIGGSPLVASAIETEEGPASNRKSRVRMSRGPLIIRIDRTPETDPELTGSDRMASLRTERLEKELETRQPQERVAAARTQTVPADGAWVAAAGRLPETRQMPIELSRQKYELNRRGILNAD
jgi:hypothetical protein